MKIADFVGLDAKMEQLMRSAQAGRIVHALLFTGPHGTGKKSMAQIFARAALCTGNDAEKPCDTCPSCKQVLNGSHPDLHFVAPEKNTIKVDQIRQLTEDLSMTAYAGGRKIAIIDRADSMNESAQNALLKTLENPVGDTMFFLLTDASGVLLPTIVSRCLQVRFRCLETEDCAKLLTARGIDPVKARTLAALAQGSVGRALELDADEGYFELRENVLSLLESENRSQIAAQTAKIAELKGREKDALEIMELWAHDLMRVQNGMEPLDTTQKTKLRASKESGSALLKQIIVARQQYNANLSWINVLESLNLDRAHGKA